MAKFKCLSCGGNLRIRTSSPISENTRKVYYECTATDCRETYSGFQSLGEVIQPSMLKVPKIAADAFILAVPEDKRAAVLKILNN